MDLEPHKGVQRCADDCKVTHTLFKHIGICEKDCSVEEFILVYFRTLQMSIK